MRKRFRQLTAVLLVVVMIALMIPITTISVSAGTVIENAISWALGIANDDSHGYSQLQNRRWGNPDYDCSTFVITAFANAGCDVEGATYTGNMRSVFENAGFTWIPKSQIDLSNSSQLVRGDILLNEANHTEIYIGNNQRVGAHTGTYDIYDRNSPGDNNGREISIYNYSNSSNWDGVLRYKDEPVIHHWYEELTPVDLGTDFYAKITTSNNHRDVCNSEGNVNLYESCDESNHVWFFIRQWDGSYKIKNIYGDNNFLDVYEALDENTNVQVWYNNNSDGQYWYIYTKDGSNYYLRPRCSDRVLDVYGGENNIGDNIGIWTFNESAAQTFRISKVPFPYTTIGNDFYAKIITSRNGLELTATNGNVDIRNKSDSPNHVWRFILQSDNSYKIVNMGDNVLDANGNVDDNVNVQMWSDNGMDSQRWYIYNNGNGYYYLKPKCADRVMDVTQALFDDGSNVGIYSYNGQDNQRFVIQKTLYPFEDIGTDFYAKISTVKNDMDVIANGGNVEIAEKSNSRNHIWYFHRKTDGSYKLKNLQDIDNYMDVYNSEDNNVNVDIWSNNEGINQDWYIYSSQDGNFLIKTKASCRFLDVTGGENNAGDNVGIWTLTQSGAQIFKIERLKIGDTNIDGSINVKDVTAIQRHLANLETFTEEQLAVADTNGDGNVDIADATHLQTYLAEYNVVLGKQT